MPKSELLEVQILARSDFGSLGFNEHGAQTERLVITIKTQMTKKRVTLLWAFGFQTLKSVRNLRFFVQTTFENRTN